MARALASNLLPLRPGRAQRVPRAEHTLSLQLPPSRFMTVRSARSLQPAPHLRCRLPAAAASAPEGRKAARQAQLCAPRSPRPRPAARWHHAARALRPPAHAPLAAHVGAAVPGSRPPHHGPPGKCAPSRVPTCRGRPRSLAHILGGGGKGKGGVRLCPPSSPTTQSPVAEIKISPIVFPPPPILSRSTDSAYALIPPNCHWWFFPNAFPRAVCSKTLRSASCVRERLALRSSRAALWSHTTPAPGALAFLAGGGGAALPPEF